MARPKRSEQTRAALISVGIEQISTHGYHGTGIKQILDEVNVPKGSFYNFFASKEAFVVELIQEYNRNLLLDLESFQQGPGVGLSAFEQLEYFYHFGIEKYGKSEKSCLIGSLSVEIGAQNNACRAALNKATGHWTSLLSELFELAQQDGDVRDDITSQQMAILYWSAWEGALLRMNVSGDTQQAKHTMDILLNQLLRINPS